jgi:hypothetical protein
VERFCRAPGSGSVVVEALALVLCLVFIGGIGAGFAAALGVFCAAACERLWMVLKRCTSGLDRLVLLGVLS